jgi:parallel beta-helix repeat protein
MSTDERFDQLLADLLDSGAPSRAPDRLVPETLRALGHAPRWPRWLAYLKEPPMRVSSRVAVGSPTARLTAIIAATLLLAIVATGAVVGATSLLAGPAVLVVAQDGSGTHETITEAVAAASDGDTILVRPGLYSEAVAVDKDVTIEGDGPRMEIIVEAPVDGPRVLVEEFGSDQVPYAFLFDATDATLVGVTVRGESSAVVVRGGDPTIANLLFEHTGSPFDGTASSILDGSVLIDGGSTVTVQDTEIVGGGPIAILGGSMPRVVGNTLSGGPSIVGEPGDGTIIRGNTITDPSVRGIGLGPGGQIGSVTIEQNVIERAESEGIDARSGSISIIGNAVTDAGQYGINTGPTSDVRIQGNTVSGTGYGISAEAARDVLIEGNALSDNMVALSVLGGVVRENALSGNTTGISLSGTADVSGNEVVDGGTGIAVTAGTPAITSNTITGNEHGLVVVVGAAPVLSGNTVCENVTNLVMPNGMGPADVADNEICADGEPAA